jgi:hypothetical protein
MNDRAREVLVQAALSGVRQIKGRASDGRGGYCAVGVLKLYHRDKTQYWTHAYDISDEEWGEIIRANDNLGWDFITIARKVGVKDEGI